MSVNIIKDKRGLTLMEIVVTIAVIGILAGVIAPLIGATIDTWSRFTENRDLMANARGAMFRMSREIRQIKDSSSLATTSSNTLAFTDIYNNSITFQQSGTNLMRNSYILATDLDSSGGLSFAYKDGNGNTTANVIDMKRIELTLKINGKNGGTVTLQNKIWPRNLQ